MLGTSLLRINTSNLVHRSEGIGSTAGSPDEVNLPNGNISGKREIEFGIGLVKRLIIKYTGKANGC